jgi:hypothetical protein
MANYIFEMVGKVVQVYSIDREMVIADGMVVEKEGFTFYVGDMEIVQNRIDHIEGNLISVYERDYVLDLFSLIERPEGFSLNRYKEGERMVIPLLKDKGYFPKGEFFTTEKDRFGPLSRGVFCSDPNKKRVLVQYG